MKVESFVDIIGSDFFTGVPDSQLRALCDYLINMYGIDAKHHIIAANEGNAVGIAAGYYMATGKVPVVYLQNSGEGNIINPVASLLSENVYGIPEIFVIGWRGEPGVHDEPQHIFQGEVTLQLLHDMQIEYFIVENDTVESDIISAMSRFKKLLDNGKSVAFVVKKEALSYNNKLEYKNSNELTREAAIECIVEGAQNDVIVCTTGKASRELFEIREKRGEPHNRDFLTVGSMGHASSIALGIAVSRPEKRVWCIDGDGAALMHLGAMAVIGDNAPSNLVHVIINNGAHESVGGMPTVCNTVYLCDIAKACGYEYVVCVDSLESLEMGLKNVSGNKGLWFMEIKVAIGSRSDLGRPKIGTNNKKLFMKTLIE